MVARLHCSSALHALPPGPGTRNTAIHEAGEPYHERFWPLPNDRCLLVRRAGASRPNAPAGRIIWGDQRRLELRVHWDHPFTPSPARGTLRSTHDSSSARGGCMTRGRSQEERA